MPFIKQVNLEWIFRHSYYPSFKDKRGYHFGTLRPRKSIEEAIEDAMESEVEWRFKK